MRLQYAATSMCLQDGKALAMLRLEEPRHPSPQALSAGEELVPVILGARVQALTLAPGT